MIADPVVIAGKKQRGTPVSDESVALRRLHIGAMGPDSLANPILAPLVDPSWIHLGDEAAVRDRNPFLRIRNGAIRRLRPIRYRMKGIAVPDAVAIRERTNFRPFYYRAGDRLSFDDETFSFAFSEHFFEHLYLDEAAALLGECHRVLRPGGVLRVATPDADLRIYERPEPAGFPRRTEKWHEPDKHKTRWSIYSLAYVLGQAGFRVRPLRHCDKFGNHLRDGPRPGDPRYAGVLDREFVFDLSYIKRLETSLVADAIKAGPVSAEDLREQSRRLHGIAG